ncbi:MAG: right-handed parallel beta-helix repeat-containing protein [Candidatus Glassbacteria bacterium]
MDVYVALSVDQGESFLTPNIKVNSVFSSPYIEQDSRHTRGNDYQGIASANGKAFPIWTDYRSDEDEDIYCAIVDVFRSGSIDSNETWSQLVVMTGDVTVKDTVMLTVEVDTSTTNTTIYALSDSDDQASGVDTTKCELIVEGQLHALGINDSSIVTFISTEVDTFPAGWYGIRLANGPDSLDWCEIEDAYIGVRSEASTSDILHCSFKVNELSGIGSTPGSDLFISNNLFDNNGQFGIGLLRPDCAEITGNDLYGNGDYGIYITAGDGDSSDIVISDNLIQGSAGDLHDYGIFFKLVDKGNIGPTYLAIDSLNYISECLQAGIRIEASSYLESLDSTSAIDSNVVEDNYNGIEISGGENLVLSWNDIIENTKKGFISSHPIPILGDHTEAIGGYNSIYDNGVYDVYVSNNTPYKSLIAQDNWWGNSAGPDTTKLYGNITFYPWLTSEP